MRLCEPALASRSPDKHTGSAHSAIFRLLSSINFNCRVHRPRKKDPQPDGQNSLQPTRDSHHDAVSRSHTRRHATRQHRAQKNKLIAFAPLICPSKCFDTVRRKNVSRSARLRVRLVVPTGASAGYSTHGKGLNTLCRLLADRAHTKSQYPSRSWSGLASYQT